MIILLSSKSERQNYPYICIATSDHDDFHFIIMSILRQMERAFYFCCLDDLIRQVSFEAHVASKTNCQDVLASAEIVKFNAFCKDN